MADFYKKECSLCDDFILNSLSLTQWQDSKYNKTGFWRIWVTLFGCLQNEKVSLVFSDKYIETRKDVEDNSDIS